MENQNDKYDVAFSFLARDEKLAFEINDLLQDRFCTFIFSKNQEQVAGTDGEKSFNEVFGSKARVVVVLYRKGWGETPWTRIEETAIRGRAYDNGYNFVIFIPLDEDNKVPKWLPKTQLWIGLNRWGVNGAAVIIEARIKEQGGEEHEETIDDRAARLVRSIKFDEKRKAFHDSEAGVNAAKNEFEQLVAELDVLLNGVKDSINSVKMEKQRYRVVVLGLCPILEIKWESHIINSLDDSSLELTLWNSHPWFSAIYTGENKKRVFSETFMFDLLPSGNYCWVTTGSPKRYFTSPELAKLALQYWMDGVETHKKRR